MALLQNHLPRSLTHSSYLLDGPIPNKPYRDRIARRAHFAPPSPLTTLPDRNLSTGKNSLRSNFLHQSHSLALWFPQGAFGKAKSAKCSNDRIIQRWVPRPATPARSMATGMASSAKSSWKLMHDGIHRLDLPQASGNQVSNRRRGATGTSRLSTTTFWSGSGRLAAGVAKPGAHLPSAVRHEGFDPCLSGFQLR